VRFNVLTGLGIAQHSIANLTRELAVEARKPGANPAHVNDAAQAASCTGAPPPMMAPPA
jgi:hypothetical protein